jgi:hypothetical protein
VEKLGFVGEGSILTTLIVRNESVHKYNEYISLAIISFIIGLK